MFKQRYLRFLALAVMAALISACNSEYHGEAHLSSSSSYHHHDDHSTYPPSLFQFHMVDTYGTSSEFEPEIDLALSPYISHGYFDIYWSADSDSDYFIELRFNTRPDTDGSRLITSEYCAPGMYCDSHQYQYCEYTASLTLECETPSGEYQGDYIGDMLYTLPEDGYMILQVCDSQFFYCEYEARHVSME